MGSTASVIAEVVAEVRQRLPDVKAPPHLEDADSERFRLFDAISAFLKAAANAQPLMLILDDLHWADKPSLTMLEFVARELASSRILIVGTYRDVELSRQHPLAMTLGDLTREHLFDRVLLRGLTRNDVARFIEVAAGVQPPRGLVDAVHTQTEGNPLFITETVRLFVQEGELTPEKLAGRDSWSVRTPEGVREVIGRRLDRLSQRCNEVLTSASVIGRQFSLDQLKAVAEETTEERLLDVIDEGLAARIIEELPDSVGDYQFTHAVVQETLSAEISLTRRVRLHGRIAESLEALYGPDADAHASMLAFHFDQAQTVLGVDRLVHYSSIAGFEALGAFGFEDAARHFARALAALADRPVDADIAELHRGASVAHGALRNLDEAISHVESAFEYYASAGDAGGAASVARLQFVSGEGQAAMMPFLRRALDMQDGDSLEAAWLLTAHGRSRSHLQDAYDEGRPEIEKALAIAREHGDQALELRVLTDLAFAHFWNLESEAGVAASEQALAVGESVDDPLAMSGAHRAVAGEFEAHGDHAQADRHIEAGIEAAGRARDRERISTNNMMHAAARIARGDWEAARAAAANSLESWPGDDRTIALLLMLEAEVGNIGEVEILRERLDLGGELPWFSVRALLEIALITGSDHDVTAALEKRDETPEGIRFNKVASVYQEQERAVAVVLSGEADEAKALYPGAASLARQIGGWSRIFDRTSPESIAGLLASRAGLTDEAVEHHEAARAEHLRAKHRPMVAWADFYLSEALLARDGPGDHEKAVELQDEAIAIARELGMKPLLERVLAQREMLTA